MSEDFENREEIIKLKGYLNSKNASEHTIKAYVKVAIEFLKFIRKDLHKVTQSEVYAFLGTIQHLSANTKNVYAWALRNLFEANGININVPIPQKSNWVEEEFQALSFDEVLQLINSTPNLKYKAMLALMWELGLRQGEVRLLKVSDVNFEKGTIFVKRLKRGKSRELPISFWCEQILYKYITKSRLKEDDWLFPNKYGEQYSWNGISIVFKSLAKKNNPEWHAHQVRHGRATFLVKQQLPIFVVAEILGHKSLESTRKYTHLSTSDINKMLYNKEEIEAKESEISFTKGLLVKKYSGDEYNIFKAQVENNATYVDSLKVNDKEIATIVLDDDGNLIYVIHFDLKFDESMFSDLKKYNILPMIVMCNDYVKMLFFDYETLNNNPELQMLVDEKIKQKFK